ncbi:N-acetylmuramoyl-L-alanine amidase [Exiguobacterium sp. s150]|uniref:N-acetylmuramoyl-L-alanine amidase n=1 Tax=Exiguobacterium sp. s150 TaxID=2751221 RepID=UPI001BE67FB1|nr:N-acetylmuramoyl-L-alanine amidase [Exiguobacterium sp. s150]
MSDILFIIDAGHAISTPGKRSPDGESEWTFNNEIAIGFEARMMQYKNAEITRVDDRTGLVDVPLIERVKKAVKLGGTAYISFHHNAYLGVWGSHGGTELFTKENPSNSTLALAKAIHPVLVESYGLRDRGIKHTNWQVINHNYMPAVLIEGGFMDSTTDIHVLRNKDKLRTAGALVADAVAKHYSLVLTTNSELQTTKTMNRTHKIVSGDTLWSISKKYNVSVKKLEMNNPKVIPHNLQIGALLYIERVALSLMNPNDSNSIKSLGTIEIHNLSIADTESR